MDTRLITAAAVALAVGGCSSAPPRDPEFAASRAQAVAQPAVANGSIYQNGMGGGLFHDQRARQVGDLITVVLVEATNASKQASTSAARDAAINLPAPSLFGGIPATYHGRQMLANSATGSQDYAGEGDSSQSNSLTGRITVTVAEVLPNGYLVVRGEKILTLNQGDEYVRFSGIVRPSDIRTDNTVISTQVADARIVYGGEGVVADANRAGWLTRFFMKVWPF